MPGTGNAADLEALRELRGTWLRGGKYNGRPGRG